MITFYFFRNIKNPLIGCFNNVLILVYSLKAWLGIYHNKILPSEPKESKL